MRYKVETTEKFDKEMKKLDNYERTQIQDWININLKNCEDPRAHGKPLTGDHKGKWRYRIGDYRLICEIQDDKLVILAIEIGHRRDIYNRRF